MMLGLMLVTSAFGQTFETITALPSRCHESSGLEYISQNEFITHNDGGDAPVLYVVDTTGQITRSVFISNANNVDWEDITMGDSSEVYVGDFGNNNQTRKDLTIYKLPPLSQWQGDTLTADTITFEFGDQTSFPPASNNKVFDCEAMAFYQDSIYLFNKNWSSPFTGMVKMYVLPAKPGHYVVQPRDSVSLGSIKEIAWVTGADITDSSLYLIGSAYAWRFEFDDIPNFSNMTQLTLNHFSQKEAITATGTTLYITDESTGGFGNLYRYAGATLNVENTAQDLSQVEVRQHTNGFSLHNNEEQDVRWQIVSLYGQELMAGELLGKDEMYFNNFSGKTILSPGQYLLHIYMSPNVEKWQQVMIAP